MKKHRYGKMLAIKNRHRPKISIFQRYKMNFMVNKTIKCIWIHYRHCFNERLMVLFVKHMFCYRMGITIAIFLNIFKVVLVIIS